MLPVKDRETLRGLAGRVREIADLPVMAERRRLWTALKDLRAGRPMVLVETDNIEGYVTDGELVCEDPEARMIERGLRHTVRHAEEIGDDFVVAPEFRLAWQVENSGCGVDVGVRYAADGRGGDIGRSFDHPFRTSDDLARLKPRVWRVDRDVTRTRQAKLQAAFGDLLPVVIHGTQAILPGLSQECFKLIGNENLLTWPYDAPDALHRLMAYLRDDRLAQYAFLEREGLLGFNHDMCRVGSGSYGFTTALPAPGHTARARLRDVWGWVESQETVSHSPEMFATFFLPYMAAVAPRFGLIYYGCCEPVHDRWDLIHAAIPHIRAVSISPWCDMEAMAAKLGRMVVFSRKPPPAPISGDTADWPALEADIAATCHAAAGCNLEFIYRDLYRVGGDRSRLRRWVSLVRRATA